MTSMIKGTGRNLAVIIGMFALSLAAFVACTTLFSLGVGLLVLVVGLFILVGCLVVAGWSSRMTMALLGAGIALPPTRYPAPDLASGGNCGVGLSAIRRDLRSTSGFILSTITFSLALTWVVGGLGGVTYWFWSRWLPQSSEGLPALLGYPGRLAELTFNTVRRTLLITARSCCADSSGCMGGGVRTAGRRDAGSASAGQRPDSEPYRCGRG